MIEVPSVVPLALARIVTAVLRRTASVVTGKLTVVAPAGTTTVAGTRAAEVLLLVSLTVVPGSARQRSLSRWRCCFHTPVR